MNTSETNISWKVGNIKSFLFKILCNIIKLCGKSRAVLMYKNLWPVKSSRNLRHGIYTYMKIVFFACCEKKMNWYDMSDNSFIKI